MTLDRIVDDLSTRGHFLRSVLLMSWGSIVAAAPLFISNIPDPAAVTRSGLGILVIGFLALLVGLLASFMKRNKKR